MIKKLLAVIFAGFSILSGFSQKIVVDQIIAVVGSNPITLSEIEKQTQQMENQGFETQGDLKCEVFEQLLVEKLLLNQALIDSIEVTEKQVESEMERRLAQFSQQAGGDDKLEEFFGKTIAQIKDDFRDIVKQQILSRRVQDKLTGELKVTPSEIQKFFKRIPQDSLPLLEGELEYSQIVFYPHVSQEEKDAVVQIMQEWKDEILAVAGKDTKKLLQEFGRKAYSYSKDPGSRDKNGELGFINKSNLAPEFAATAMKLKPYEISDVVKTDFGYHLIMLLERKGDMVNCMHILQNNLVSQKSKDKALQRADSIRLLIKDTMTFERISKMYSEDEDTRLNGGLVVNPYTGNSKFLNEMLDKITLYHLKELGIGEIGKSVGVVDDKMRDCYKIFMLKSRTLPHVASLKTDYEKIQEMALEDKKQQVMDAWVQNKQKTSYIRIDPAYRNCKFKHKDWLKP